MDHLDDLIHETSDPFAKSTLLGFWFKAQPICWSKNDEGFSERRLFNAKGIATFIGFQHELARTVRAYDNQWDLGQVPCSKMGLWCRSYRSWLRDLNFETYFREYAPENLDIISSQQGRIDYWM